jgi:GTP cyclohydrolase I
MDSPPLNPVPKTSRFAKIPSSDSQGSRAPYNPRERDTLFDSIAASTVSRKPINFDELHQKANGPIELTDRSDQSANAHMAVTMSHPHLKAPPRDPRDQPSTSSPMLSRPASPYTSNPPIDFDGLSWPSKYSAIIFTL